MATKRTAPKMPASLIAKISDDEIRTILAQAEQSSDRFTVAEAKRALKGDQPARLACAMILGR